MVLDDLGGSGFSLCFPYRLPIGTLSILHLRRGDRRVYFRVVLAKSICCYINGHHKQYIQIDIIFNYMFHFGLPGKCLYLNPQTHLSGAGGVGARKVYFPDFSKDIFLEVQNETCS